MNPHALSLLSQSLLSQSLASIYLPWLTCFACTTNTNTCTAAAACSACFALCHNSALTLLLLQLSIDFGGLQMGQNVTARTPRWMPRTHSRLGCTARCGQWHYAERGTQSNLLSNWQAIPNWAVVGSPQAVRRIRPVGRAQHGWRVRV